MKQRIRNILVISLVLATMWTVVAGFVSPDGLMNALVDVTFTQGGETLVTSVDGDRLRFSLLNGSGVVVSDMSLPRTHDGRLVTIEDAALADDGTLCVIQTLHNRLTGEREGQLLELYAMNRLFAPRLSSLPLENEQGIDYRYIELSGHLVTLMGVDENEHTVLRATYERAQLASGLLAETASREYAIKQGEGIYEVVTLGSDIAYISRTGKVFVTGEESVREVYPARELQTLMYAMYIAPLGTDLFVLEQESANMLRLNTADRTTTLLKTGTEPFAGVSDYAPEDIAAIAVQSPQLYTAIVTNRQTGYYELVLCRDGAFTMMPQLQRSLWWRFLLTAGRILLLTLMIGVALFLVWGIITRVRRGRTLFIKLTATALPLVAVSLLIFGVFSYNAYRDSIYESYEKQVTDEGNLLAALFGVDNFEEVEYPYDWGGEAYKYLIDQMSKREIYSRTAWYERQTLYTGVGDGPCAYPFAVRLNTELTALHRQAAISGKPQVGVVSDAAGQRITCVTPVGGTAGETVYLVETGILIANVDGYMGRFIRNYLIIAIVTLVVVSLLLLGSFIRVLTPLGQLREGLQEFASGNRRYRITSNSTDELADIGRVFNDMAGEIDRQMYTLKSVTDSYSRFVPMSLFTPLHKDSLAGIEQGNGVEGDYCILCADLLLRADLPTVTARQLTDHFFHTLNALADRHKVTLMQDEASLHSLKLLCGETADAGVAIAVSALTQLDSLNAGLPIHERMECSFFLHYTPASYAISGDDERLVPSLLTPELDAIEGRSRLGRRMGSRLLVTQAAFETLHDRAGLSFRFLGRPTEEAGLELYDFYDNATPEQSRKIHLSQPTFGKALQLYREGRYYEAKNLFAIVLRDNQFDNAARHYVFRCEEHLRAQGR